MSQSTEDEQLEASIEASVTTWEEWQKIVSGVAERTGMSFDEALQFEAIRRIDLVRHHLSQIARATEAGAEYQQRVAPLVERMMEEYDEYESWKHDE